MQINPTAVERIKEKVLRYPKYDLMSNAEENVHKQAHGHDTDTVDGKAKSSLANDKVVDVLEVPTPLLAPSPCSGFTPVLSCSSSIFDVRVGLINVIIFLEQALVMATFGVADLVVKEARQDEADGRGSRATDIGKNLVQAAD